MPISGDRDRRAISSHSLRAISRFVDVEPMLAERQEDRLEPALEPGRAVKPERPDGKPTKPAKTSRRRGSSERRHRRGRLVRVPACP